MKLSIIIPTIGRDTLNNVLNRLIASQKKEGNSLEILVIFDGKESDKVKKISQKFDKDTFIKFSATGQKVFAAGARNRGLKLATGNIISFLGDDTIPNENWLKHQFKFHKNNPQESTALLGKVQWSNKLSKDRFHQFLDRGVQFNFPKLDAGHQPNWQYFYTSNISFKKSILEEKETLLQFSEKFTGWGFEDSELGYRLEKKGLKITYNNHCLVYHYDPQTLEGLVKRTKQAHKNALVFQQLHPEVNILPKGCKLQILKALIPIAKIGGKFKKEYQWWASWKQAWIQK